MSKTITYIVTLHFNKGGFGIEEHKKLDMPLDKETNPEK